MPRRTAATWPARSPSSRPSPAIHCRPVVTGSRATPPSAVPTAPAEANPLVRGRGRRGEPVPGHATSAGLLPLRGGDATMNYEEMSLVRYFDGQFLTTALYTLEQSYFINSATYL